MPGFPDYLITDISTTVALELLVLLQGQNCSYELAQWKMALADDVDLAVAHEIAEFSDDAPPGIDRHAYDKTIHRELRKNLGETER